MNLLKSSRLNYRQPTMVRFDTVFKTTCKSLKQVIDKPNSEGGRVIEACQSSLPDFSESLSRIEEKIGFKRCFCTANSR